MDPVAAVRICLGLYREVRATREGVAPCLTKRRRIRTETVARDERESDPCTYATVAQSGRAPRPYNVGEDARVQISPVAFQQLPDVVHPGFAPCLDGEVDGKATRLSRRVVDNIEGCWVPERVAITRAQ